MLGCIGHYFLAFVTIITAKNIKKKENCFDKKCGIGAKDKTSHIGENRNKHIVYFTWKERKRRCEFLPLSSL
jgi:hypothetical protein